LLTFVFSLSFAALGLGQKSKSPSSFIYRDQPKTPTADDGLLNLHLPLLASKQSPSSNAASPQTQSSTPSSDLGLGDLTGLLSAGSDDTPGQTNIWTFHAKSNRLFAQYTNPDGCGLFSLLYSFFHIARDFEGKTNID